jgi:transposase
VKLDQEARMTIRCLSHKGQSNREIARLLQVSEGAVRYHRRRDREGAVDGRGRQRLLAEDWGEAIAYYVDSLEDEGWNAAALYDWLVAEKDYPGSLRSLQRYMQRRYPKPGRRARRRVETPPGAQGQVDWAEWRGVWISGRPLVAYQFHLRLSHSRYGARVWSARKDQLSWHRCHNEAFRRLHGVPAVLRVDNEKTAVSRGAGAWGELNPSYRRYAQAVRFHIDACGPRHPEGKGKVERGIRGDRGWTEILRRRWECWEELQWYTDERMIDEASRRLCPATGTLVAEAWEAEKPHLAPVPLLPEPFDVALTRRVALDCTVAFEGRRYSVPYRWMDQRVEVRGCAQVVQVYAGGAIVAEHPRGSRERILIDPAHYEADPDALVGAPMPLGRMGRRLQEIAALCPQQRPVDLYAALAEVAR